MPDCESGCTPLKGIFFQFHSLFHGEEDDGEEPSLEIFCFSWGCGVTPHASAMALGGTGPYITHDELQRYLRATRKNQEANSSPGRGSAPAPAEQKLRVLLSLGTKSGGLTESTWEEGNYRRITSMET